MKFEIIEQFREQKERRETEHQELVRLEGSALEEVHALRAEYEKALRDSMVERRDMASELDVLADRIALAEREYDRRKYKRELYSSVVKPNITEQQVVDSWNTDLKPKYEKQVIAPILERLVNAKSEFSDAFLSYKEALKDFESNKADAVREIGDHYQYKLSDVGLTYHDDKVRHFITTSTLIQLERNDVPSDVITMIHRKDVEGAKLTVADKRLVERARRANPQNPELPKLEKGVK